MPCPDGRSGYKILRKGSTQKRKQEQIQYESFSILNIFLARLLGFQPFDWKLMLPTFV